MQGEQIKAQAKAQTDMAKMQQDAQIKMAELGMEQQKMGLDQQKVAMADDLKRDQMDQDLLVDAAKVLGQYGTQVDVASIKAAQNANR